MKRPIEPEEHGEILPDILKRYKSGLRPEASFNGINFM